MSLLKALNTEEQELEEPQASGASGTPKRLEQRSVEGGCSSSEPEFSTAAGISPIAGDKPGAWSPKDLDPIWSGDQSQDQEVGELVDDPALDWDGDNGFWRVIYVYGAAFVWSGFLVHLRGSAIYTRAGADRACLAEPQRPLAALACAAAARQSLRNGSPSASRCRCEQRSGSFAALAG